MKKVYQTQFGTPDGNCMAACVASLFERSLEEVEEALGEADHEWPGQMDAYVNQFGYAMLAIPACRYLWAPGKARIQGQRMEALDVLWPSESDCYCIAVGRTTERGLRHAVICKGRTLIHDPHQGGHGLDTFDSIIVFVKLGELVGEDYEYRTSE